MEKTVFTTLCMVCDGAGSVLVQERPGPHWPGVAFPGGHVEHGESFTGSVVREVWEETGYTIEDPRLCGIKQFPLEDGGLYVVLLYRADRFSGELRSSEEGRVFWVRREELARLPLARDMMRTVELMESGEKSEIYYFLDHGEMRSQVL